MQRDYIKMYKANEWMFDHYQCHQYNVPASMENQSRIHRAFAILPVITMK